MIFNENIMKIKFLFSVGFQPFLLKMIIHAVWYRTGGIPTELGIVSTRKGLTRMEYTSVVIPSENYD